MAAWQQTQKLVIFDFRSFLALPYTGRWVQADVDVLVKSLEGEERMQGGSKNTGIEINNGYYSYVRCTLAGPLLSQVGIVKQSHIVSMNMTIKHRCHNPFSIYLEL